MAIAAEITVRAKLSRPARVVFWVGMRFVALGFWLINQAVDRGIEVSEE